MTYSGQFVVFKSSDPDYSTESLIRDLSSISYSNSDEFLAQNFLEKVRDTMEEFIQSGRGDIPVVTLFLTAGSPEKDENLDIDMEAMDGIKALTKLMVIGIGDISKADLSNLASPPSEKNTVMATDSDGIADLGGKIAKSICESGIHEDFCSTGSGQSINKGKVLHYINTSKT